MQQHSFDATNLLNANTSTAILTFMFSLQTPEQNHVSLCHVIIQKGRRLSFNEGTTSSLHDNL